MIRERNVKGPVDSVDVNGKTYRVEYRRRYYEPGVHFTWIEVEIAPNNWDEVRDAIKTGPARFGKGMTRKFVRDEVSKLIADKFIENHFVFCHIGGDR